MFLILMVFVDLKCLGPYMCFYFGYNCDKQITRPLELASQTRGRYSIFFFQICAGERIPSGTC